MNNIIEDAITTGKEFTRDKIDNIILKNEQVKESLTETYETTKKYGKFALTFGIYVLFILATFFFVQNTFIILNVRSASEKDYTSFSEIIVSEDAQKIGYWTSSLMNDLRIYSDSDVSLTGNINNIIKFLQAHKSIRNETFDYVMFCTPDGIGYLDDGTTITVVSKKYFTVIDTDRAEYFVSDIEFLNDGRSCFYISRPAFDVNNKFIGVYAGAVKLGEIEKMVNDLQVGAGGKAILAGSNGVLLSHMKGEDKLFDLNYSDKIGYEGLSDLKEVLKNQETKNSFYTDKNGVENFISCAPVPGTPWTAILSIPVSQINNASVSLRTKIYTVSAIICMLTIVVCIFLIFRMMKPLKFVRDSIEDIATGDADLTKQINVKSKNEIGELGDGFNRFIAKLRMIIGGVKDSKETMESVNNALNQRIGDNGSSIEAILNDLHEIDTQVATQVESVGQTANAVEEISMNIESLEKMLESQGTAVEEASAAVEEMIGNIRSVNLSVGHMANSFNELAGKAEEGITRQNAVNDKIVTIEEQSKTLQDANKVISSIASQTNLLAMNAAIEAAHAGEAGRGFSVVADEIRKLSENSSRQSKKIKDELNNIQSSISEVVNASMASSESFGQVSSSIQKTEQLVIQIKSAMDEQENGSQQIGNSLKLMNDSTSEVRQASIEMNEGNKAILKEMNELKESAAEIKNSMDKISDSATNIRQTSESLTEITNSVSATVSQIGDQIDLFKV